MPQKPLTPKQLREVIDAVDRYGSIVGAAGALKINRNTMQSRYNLAKAWARGAEREPEPEPVVLAPAKKPKIRVQAGNENNKTMRVLAIGDAHDSPSIDKDRFAWIGKHAADFGADWIVSIGDWATLDSLNSHIGNETLGGRSKGPYADDISSLAESIGALNSSLGSHRCNKHITLGNHERRAWTYEDMHPEMAGAVTGEILKTFEDGGWEHTDYGEYFFLGGVGFIHAAINRLNKTYGGKNAEVTIANDATFDHVIGHSHVRREHRAPKLGPMKHVTILNLGCALPWGHVEEYMLKGSPTGWWWGVHELLISGGQIVGTNAIPMTELKRRHG